MELKQMKCPNCHADLDIDDSLDTFFCKYCGTKLYIDGQTSELIEAKTKVKLADKAIELDRERHRQEMEKKQLEMKETSRILGILLFLALLGIAGLVFLAYR